MFMQKYVSEDNAFKLGLIDKIAEEDLGFFRECPFDKALQENLARAWIAGKYGTDDYFEIRHTKNLKYSKL